MTTLRDLITAFEAAKTTWDAAGPDSCSSDPEYEAYWEAEMAVLRFPCLTIDDVREKAKFFLSSETRIDTIENCNDGEQHCAVVFLKALLGQESAA